MKNKTIKKFIPSTLLGRSLVIVFVPIVSIVIITCLVFYQTSWDIISKRLSQSVVGDIGAVIELIDEKKINEAKDIIKPKLDLNEAKLLSQKHFNFKIKLLENEFLNVKDFKPKKRILERRLSDELKRLNKEFVFDTTNLESGLKIKIQVNNDILIINVDKDRLYSGRAFVFILWMIFSSVILFFIAYIFMKNQTRPLKKLSILAETFGRGLDVPNFQSSGSIEIRQTANAFNVMRTRIKRFLKQRTEMLAGVSHDLRTPLTRIKLQTSMLKDNKLKNELHSDITEMTAMLDSYLSFARGEISDPIEKINFKLMLKDIINNLKSNNKDIELLIKNEAETSGRPAQLKRCFVNIIENAKRYGDIIKITLKKNDEDIIINIEDNGRGIKKENFNDVFRPFFTLDKSRNKETGGSGLGMTISRDIIRSHGGDIILNKSQLGGLKVTINIPK
mgnify:CR=1 FL=1|tara:strand:+ start:1124 stop:2467 length:1344 start_codon:yes stop_codon:yes gene_type:complete